jgi:hypothetical protein
MNEIITKMRADWTIVAQDRRACGEWTETDEQDIGEAVKAAVASGQQEQIILWSRWLGDLSASTIALKAIILGIDTRIRDAARKHREAKAK